MSFKNVQKIIFTSEGKSDCRAKLRYQATVKFSVANG